MTEAVIVIGRLSVANRKVVQGIARAKSAPADQNILGRSMGSIALTCVALLAGQPAHARTPVVPAGQVFQCTPTAVWDGDGPVLCKEGPKLRLAGIAAREIDGSCRGGQPCPAVSGSQARDTLVSLLGGAKGKWADGHIKVSGATLRCRSAGSGKGQRTAAWCVLPGGQNLSCAMIASGTAVRWARFDPENICPAGSAPWQR